MTLVRELILSLTRSPVTWAVWAACGLTNGAMAQTQAAPNIGDVLRSVEPSIAPVPRATDPDAVTVTKPQATISTSSVPIRVRGIKITGATVMKEEALTALVGDLMGKTVTLAELQAAAQRITNLYEDAGYPVARAVLPAQDIVDGVVEFMVLEGRVGRVSIDNRSLIKDASAQRLLGAIPVGSAVHEPTLERQLLLLGETPGASRATVTLQPGLATGETDLRVQVEPGPRVAGQIDADNHGNRYTGYRRVASLINVNSPLGLGDRFQVRSLLTDENLGSIRFEYRVPVSSTGLAVGAAWSDVHYDLGREFAFLRANGRARISTLFASYPLLRSVDANVQATISFDDKSFRDRIGAVADSDTRKGSSITSVTFNAYGNVDPVIYALAAVISHGRLHLDTASARAADASNARTHGPFSKVVATGNVLWPFKPNWALYGSLYGQFSSKNLDSSEEITLGGPAGVRAYPQGESSGDEGYIVSGELRYTIPLRPVQLAAFVDYGGLRVNRKVLQFGRNNRYLQGAGASVTWAPRPDVGLKFMVATRLGDGQVVSEPKDAHTQFWLQALWRF